jgi:hypothetical protein
MLPVTIKGRQYIISTDESGGAGGAGGLPAACARGASAWGYPQIIDITDETKPKIVAKLMLQVSDPANCSLQVNDPPDVGSGIPNYSAERCTVDRPNDATMLACGFVNAGLRVFDIRDPYHPKEIAYWKPPAVRTAFLPGSGSWTPGVDLTVDKIAGYVRWHKVVPANEMHRPQWELWTVSDGNGFQILRLTDAFKRSTETFPRTRASKEIGRVVCTYAATGAHKEHQRSDPAVLRNRYRLGSGGIFQTLLE